MFYRNEHYMSISHVALIVNMVHIHQSSRITGASSSDCLVSYPGHSLVGGSCPSAKNQSVYSTTPDDWETSLEFELTVTWWLTETRRWEWYSPPVELKLSSSQKVTVRNECGSHRCLHLSDLGSPDIGRGRIKWSQMIGGGTPNGSGVPFPSTEVNTKKGSFWASPVADGR